MSIAAELRELDRSPKALRRFGLQTGVIFAGLGLLFYLRHRQIPGLAASSAGGLLIAMAIVHPPLLRRVHTAWMALALGLGLVSSTILLTLVFVIVLTPLGWIARVSGRDFLQRRLDHGATTYWQMRPRGGDGKRRMEQQF
jgi:Saxitoxin biosynthesis operon protein SxtJ